MITQSARATTQSVRTTIPSVRTTIPSVRTTIPSVTATIPSARVTTPLSTPTPSLVRADPWLNSTSNNRFGQSGAFCFTDSNAFNWQLQSALLAGNDCARALLNNDLTERLCLLITRVDSALVCNEYNCEQLVMLNRLACGIDDALIGDQNELLNNVQGLPRLLEESVALLGGNTSDDFQLFLKNQSFFINEEISWLNLLTGTGNPYLMIEDEINDRIQAVEQIDNGSEEP